MTGQSGELKVIGRRTLFVIALAAVLLIPACTFLPQKSWKPGMALIEPTDPVTKVKVVLHFPASDWKNLVREERDAVSRGEASYLTAFRELARGPSAGQGLPSIPAGTVLLSDPVLSGGVLYLNFSKISDIRSAPGPVERLVLQSLVYTLTEAKEVTAVQVLVDGQKLKTLAGSVNVSNPLKRQNFAQQGGPVGK
ncbi:MAG: GerMN domain-containing protein [Bacillota bacterium]|jgi:spore germination protein GerM|nr:GerMN domain-containing protein [Bacillota bacterium]